MDMVEKITGLEQFEVSSMKLQEEGKTAMFVAIITGDNRRTTATVASKVGLDAVEAEIEPARKIGAFLYNALGIPVRNVRL
jgi:cation transport ATPase